MDETNESANPPTTAARQMFRVILITILRLGKRRVAIADATKTVSNTSTRPVISPKYNLRKSILSSFIFTFSMARLSLEFHRGSVKNR